MPTAPASSGPGPPPDFLLGSYRVQPTLLRVAGPDGAAVQVEPRVMDVLLCLVAAPGTVITREQLVEQVWSGAYVSDDVLTRAIAQLRRTFADDAGQPKVIETIRKRGYRLLVMPERTNPTALAPPVSNQLAPQPAPARSAFGHRPRLMAALLAGAVAAVLGAAFVARSGVRSAADASRLTPVPIAPGSEIRRPRISPDGTRIAFATEKPGGHLTVAVALMRGGDVLELSAPPAGAHDVPLAWSPDGSEVAYARQRGAACEVRIVPALGGQDRPFGPCGDAESPALAWSPDGKFFVESWKDGPPGRRLRVEAVDGNQPPRFLTTPPKDILGDSDPAISPDGSTVAFARSIADDVDDLWTVPLAGGAEHRITFDHATIVGLDWLTDGHSLVFSSSRAGINSLWEVDAAGGPPRFLTGASPKIKHPSSARTTSRVVFESWDYEINLRRVELPSGSTAPLLSSPDWTWSPRYSPDGRRVAFLSTRSGSPEVWTADLPDGAAQQLTHFGGPQLADPAWSPDGERLAFTARPEGRADLYVIGSHGGSAKRLSTGSADALRPSFSHDGRFVYVSVRRGAAWQLERLDAATGVTDVLTVMNGFRGEESRDGTALVYTRADRSGLFERPLGGGGMVSERRLLSDLSPADAQAWEIGPAGLFLEVVVNDRDRLVRVADDGSRPLVSELPDLAWKGFSVRPDGREALYAHLDRRACRFVLLDQPPRSE